jgi:hypothetical protein
MKTANLQRSFEVQMLQTTEQQQNNIREDIVKFTECLLPFISETSVYPPETYKYKV